METLQPATADELRAALKALFDQFPAPDGNSEGKYLGYFMALEGEPKWAVERAARKFIRGEVAEHDGRFLPSSAELARIVRSYSDHARKIRDLSERTRQFKPLERVFANPDIPSNPEMAARIRKVISGAAGRMNLDALNWRGFPSLQEFQSWKLPTGTIFVGADRTVIYPDGTVETWAAIESRMRKAAPPKPSEPEPLVEEVAVAPSPELLAAMRRKEWLAKQERGEGEEPVDPQAWRFEMADTHV
jgi:hypothetical protein